MKESNLIDREASYEEFLQILKIILRIVECFEQETFIKIKFQRAKNCMIQNTLADKCRQTKVPFHLEVKKITKKHYLLGGIARNRHL